VPAFSPLITLRSANPAKVKTDALVVGLVSAPAGKNAGKGAGVEVAPGGEEIAAAYGRRLRPLLASLGATGKEGEVLRVPAPDPVAAGMLVLVGLGALPADGEVDPQVLRRTSGAAIRALVNAANAAFALPATTPAQVAAIVEGAALGGFTYSDYKSAQTPADRPGELMVLTAAARRSETQSAVDEALVVAEAVAQARAWVNTPPGNLTPPVFADVVVAAAAAASKGRGARKVSAKVLDEKALTDLGCGGILGVGAGSAAESRMVELSYSPAKPVAHLALVGKGVTFDSGGLTIKPAAAMNDMKSDMAGAAAVVQATLAIARLKLPIKVSTFVPMAENMISGNATRPGDVLSMYGGTTVEVLNTDAEGRLLLGDALGRAVEVDPDVILDVATLTGAMVVALGDRIAGVLGSDEIVGDVVAAGETAGEPLWPMPIPSGMVERVHSSKIADLAQHDWIRWGGGLFAAAFLREFTGGKPWAHLDIAGPSWNSGGPSGHLTSGGTGFAVATLVAYARALGQPTHIGSD
jgi:leucyl aminopeptidase